MAIITINEQMMGFLREEMVSKSKIHRMIIILLIMTTSVAADDNWDGDFYQENSQLQYRWATEYLEKLPLQGSERILDIGCGDGRVSAAFAWAVPKGEVVGVDHSESMLKTAWKMLEDRVDLRNLSFCKMDATDLTFDAEFDLAVSFSCFHWIPNHLAALQGIQRSLKPGGKFFLYFAPDHGRERFDHAIDEVMSLPQWNHYFENFSSSFVLATPAGFVGLMEQAGLLLTRVEVITVDEVFEDRKAFLRWIKGWMPHLKYLPEDHHDLFINAIIDKYLEAHPLDAQGLVHYYDYWLEVEGERPNSKVTDDKIA